MLSLDYSFDTAGENLAFDEILLRYGANEHCEVLRFWESPSPFVVLGLTQKHRDEVDVERCLADHIPIRRRCSAGGCVMQGPGCLNYTLILSKALRPEIHTIQESYRYIFDKLIAEISLEGLAKQGVSDMALKDLKVSGNAQRRQKEYILHHGTLLYEADLECFSRYIREPQDRPEYRKDREHASFIRNLPKSRIALIDAIAKAFSAEKPVESIDNTLLQETRQLADEKYDTDTWIYRK